LEELVSFCPESDQASPSTPYGNLVIGPGGTLYGTSYYGGTAGYGTVFSLTPPAAAGGAWTETVLYSFQGVPTAPGPKAVSRSAAAVCCTALLSQAELVHATWSVSVAAQLTH
jgi:uncharacterized repeat protein (TIGR03803 family)